MNLGGKVYDITHKAKGKVQLGNNMEYCGRIFNQFYINRL